MDRDQIKAYSDKVFPSMAGAMTAGMAYIVSERVCPPLSRGREAMETAQIRQSWTDPDAYETFMGRWSEHLAKPFLSLAGIESRRARRCGGGSLARHRAWLPDGRLL